MNTKQTKTKTEQPQKIKKPFHMALAASYFLRD